MAKHIVFGLLKTNKEDEENLMDLLRPLCNLCTLVISPDRYSHTAPNGS